MVQLLYGAVFYEGIGSVSYTHLDVYKRQAYIKMMHTPITTHSRNIARPSGIREVSVWCIQLVTILKSNTLFIYYLQFTIYNLRGAF